MHRFAPPVIPATRFPDWPPLLLADSKKVFNGSTDSAATTLEIDNPAPTIGSVSPATEVMGTASLSVAVTGTGFVPTTVINVNGTARSTSYTSATQVTVTLTAADVRKGWGA